MKHLVRISIASLWVATVLAAEPAPQTPAEPPQGERTTQPSEDLSATAQPRVNTSPSDAPPGGAPPAAKDKPVGSDRLQLDTTIVTGNRELPKVLYIVPWKKADSGELPSQPFNSLLDEALTPVDRDVFRREVSYYGVINAKPGEAPAAVSTAEQQTAPAKK